MDATDEFHGPQENAQLGAVWLFVIMIIATMLLMMLMVIVTIMIRQW